MGLYPQPSAPESLFWGGWGGGLAVIVCTLPCGGGGGSPVGAPSGMAEKTRWRPLGSWAPSRKNLGFAGGDSAIWYGMVWYGMVWYGMVWYGMVWYGMVWYGMVWYGMLLLLCCCEGTQHVPAGEIARHALPGQGAREQSAGVTLAGRVPTTTEGGGGGAPWCGGGGGCARTEEGGATCLCYPGALPRCGGEGDPTCA